VASAGSDSGNKGGTPPSRTCTVYEHRDYGGAHWTLRNGDVLRMVRAPDVGTSDGIHRFIYQPSWNDRQSVGTDPGCRLTLWRMSTMVSRFVRTRVTAYAETLNDKARTVCECSGSPNW
jgi:hypothetical protein